MASVARVVHVIGQSKLRPRQSDFCNIVIDSKQACHWTEQIMASVARVVHVITGQQLWPWRPELYIIVVYTEQACH